MGRKSEWRVVGTHMRKVREKSSISFFMNMICNGLTVGVHFSKAVYLAIEFILIGEGEILHFAASFSRVK